MRFNPPPGWPEPPAGWAPPSGWQPDPSWPAPPPDWQLWVPEESDQSAEGREAHTSIEPEVAGVEKPPGSHGEHGTISPLATPSSIPSPESAPLLARIFELEEALAVAHGRADAVSLNDQQVLQEAGIYRYHHPLEDAAAYRDQLAAINTRIDHFVKSGEAVLASELFTLDGSLAKGRRMTRDLSLLMLRAYNAEAENCVRSLRSGNAATAKSRLERAMRAIQRLGTTMELRINPDYHQLRVEEIELTADFQMKLQEERERAREARAELREQRRVEAELAAERARLDKERAHYVTALETLRTSGDTEAISGLEARLGEIDAAIAANDYRAANIRAGYIYVISNIGALGPNVVKIGMTRRLEPRDRVRELGDASVPFLYDTHALFFSDDAVSLERELHMAFEHRRVNHVNARREFFFATPAEVRKLLLERFGGLLEFHEDPEATEYYQSRGRWPTLDAP